MLAGSADARHGADHRTATERTRTVRAQVRQTWGEPPRTADTLPEWATRQAGRRAEADYLRALPIRDAAARIEATRTEQEQRQQATRDTDARPIVGRST